MNDKNPLDAELAQWQAAHQAQAAPEPLRAKLLRDYRHQFKTGGAQDSKQRPGGESVQTLWVRAGAVTAVLLCSVLLFQLRSAPPVSQPSQTNTNRQLVLADATAGITQLSSALGSPSRAISGRFRPSLGLMRPEGWPTLASLTTATTATKNQLNKHP